jgi:hypothetical protein
MKHEIALHIEDLRNLYMSPSTVSARKVAYDGLDV